MCSLRCHKQIKIWYNLFLSTQKVYTMTSKKQKAGKYRFIDLFAGIGGIRLGFESTKKCSCVFSSEWDKDAQKTYEANHGKVDAGDITKVDPKTIPDFDILTGGFPCQPFSMIGKREGFKHPTQGTLFFYIQNILAVKKPKAFLLENVPGLVNHADGATLNTIRDVLRNELGYTTDFMVLNAADFGVPQYRKRLYIVGFRKDIPAFVNGNDAGNGLPISRDKRTHKGKVTYNFPKGKFVGRHVGFGQFVEKKADGPSISERLQKSYIFKKDDGHPEIVDENFSAPVKTLCASYHKIQRITGTFVRGGKTGLRLLTENECKYIMGFDKKTIGRDFVIPVCRTSMYHQFGNSVAVPVIMDLAKEMVKVLDAVGKNGAKKRRKA